MSENTDTPSERPYDPAEDPDADPGNLASKDPAQQPDQAEGEDDGSSPTG